MDLNIAGQHEGCHVSQCRDFLVVNAYTGGSSRLTDESRSSRGSSVKDSKETSQSQRGLELLLVDKTGQELRCL